MKDGPSETARRVAAQRLTFARLATSYGQPDADERLARDVAGTASGSVSPLRSYLEARTRFFDRVVVDAVNAGMKQIVVGASGYDGRAWRYAKPGVRWFEVDHPATQADKLRRLQALGIGSSHVGFAAADFGADPLGPGLVAAGFDPVVPALFLLEGVAVYLEREVLDSVLRQLRDVAADGSRLAVSLSVSRGSPGADSRRRDFQAAVARLGEPARSTVAGDQIPPLLAATGWCLYDPAGGNEESSGRLSAGLVVATPA